MGYRTNLKYKSNTGAVARIIISDDDLNFPANGQPTEASTPFMVVNKPGERAQGFRPRGVQLRRLVRAEDKAIGAAAQYEYRTVTILTPELFATLEKDDVITYQGKTFILHGFFAEEV
jgi:hypothetical protein